MKHMVYTARYCQQKEARILEMTEHTEDTPLTQDTHDGTALHTYIYVTARNDRSIVVDACFLRREVLKNNHRGDFVPRKLKRLRTHLHRNMFDEESSPTVRRLYGRCRFPQIFQKVRNEESRHTHREGGKDEWCIQSAIHCNTVMSNE